MDAKKEFEAFVNANQKEQMEDFWPLINVFKAADTPNPKRFGFEMGWLLALGWIGDLLGVKLAQPNIEDREKIKKIFEDAM